MGFVEDDGTGGGKDAGIGCVTGLQLDVEVGEKEVVVDDDDFGLERLASHAGDEAVFPIRAGLAETGVGAGVELVPEQGVFGDAGEFGAVAGGGRGLPCGDVVELLDFFQARQHGGVAQGVEFGLAEIVGAPFHVADIERTVLIAEHGLKKGNVLEVELLLQVLGAGGDDDTLATLAGEAECGQQVGEGFAGAGTSFDDEVPLVFECAFDGGCHFILAAAVFEGERGLGEDAAGREEIVQGGEPETRSARDGGCGGHLISIVEG